MGNKVIVTADSTVDLSQSLLDRYAIRIIPLTILLGNTSFPDTKEFTNEEMYRRYHADGTLPKTAAPSVQQFIDFFAACKAEGCDVVHIDISSELSSTYSTACIAAQEFEGVYCVDSRMLSTGGGLLAIEAAESAENGMSAEDIYTHISSLTDKVDTSFVLDTLKFMWKGGRCTGVEALGANLLSLKPALEMRDGKLVVYKKYRGNIHSVYKQYIKERLSGKSIRPGHVFITHSGEVDSAVLEALQALVRDTIPVDALHVTQAGCTVSSHCGPGTLGVLFIRE